MNRFALDFDGVLCNSAAENAVTAWRAGAHLWPHWQGAEPPSAYQQRFLRLRPLIETGYQTILLMGLIAEGVSDDQLRAQFTPLADRLLHRIGRTPADLVALFGATRDAWIAADLADWLGRHHFYPGVRDRFAAYCRTEPCFILTTKQQRFIVALLAGQGIPFPAEHIYGLDRGRRKEEILEDLLGHPEHIGATWHFVEDRLPTLRRVAARPALAGVRLYLADWGYNTPADHAAARAHPAITVWSPEQFLRV